MVGMFAIAHHAFEGRRHDLPQAMEQDDPSFKNPSSEIHPYQTRFYRL